MNTKKRNKKRLLGWSDLWITVITCIPIIAALLLYDRLPEQMAVHFNISGSPDGYQSKNTFLLTFGLLVLVLPYLLHLFRRIDPNKSNYDKFTRAFTIVRGSLAVFFSGIFGFTIAYNIGYQLDVQLFVLVGMGLLFMIFGNYMGQFRFNYFVGIRTPWTLVDEQVWKRTHRLAGPLWMIAGLLLFIAAFLPPGIAAVGIIGAAIVLCAVVPTIYSYICFRNGKIKPNSR